MSMNISEAKNQVKYTVTAYLSKDEAGEYLVPVERQRPLFLIGPPGIGKTDIMAQVAYEMDIALVAYSMTHHTRQSALGLPYIKEKEYGGREFRTTEYTMSEIIASVYDAMEDTGKKEGILFLDEINCISETLAPSMLQFLQQKIFGRHRLPEGWVVITAGNPPEYNSSVRPFDLATMDRLKLLEVEPDYQVWKKYAVAEGIHSSVLNYLEVKPDDFYSVRTTVDGKEFVTARGWVDLATMIRLYEKNELPINLTLIGQYIQDERIARDFAAYYELFHRYRRTYDVAKILEGHAGEEVLKQVREAPLDERITLVRLLTDALNQEFRSLEMQEKALAAVTKTIRDHKDEIMDGTTNEAASLLHVLIPADREEMRRAKAAHGLPASERMRRRQIQKMLGEMETLLSVGEGSGQEIIRGYLKERNEIREATTAEVSQQLENAFRFLEQAFGESNEMLIFVTTLTDDKAAAYFIARHGSESYYRYNKELLFYERGQGLIDEMEAFLKEE